MIASSLLAACAKSSAAFDPAAITGLQLFLQYGVLPQGGGPNCSPSAPGGPVSTVAASYGTTRTASQALLLRPTYQTNGLSYDGGAAQFMNLSSNIVLNGAFTAYSVFNAPATDDCIQLGSVLGAALFGLVGGQYNALDDGGNGPASGLLGTGLFLARISSTGASATVKVTGGGTSSGGAGTFTFDSIGASGGNSIFSGSTTNRSLLDIIKTGDNSGTAEDTNILAWILANYGAAL